MMYESILRKAYQALLDKKAADPVILSLAKLTPVADYFLICSCRSSIQIKTIADFLRETMDGEGAILLRREGKPEVGWVLMDYGWMVVHIMLEDLREFYGLERLWYDAERVEFPREMSQE